jgi:hypothetical protein
MCLITDQLEPLVAKKNITVYKVLRYDLHSLYHYNHFYTIGELKEETMKESINFLFFNDLDGKWVTFFLENNGECYKYNDSVSIRTMIRKSPNLKIIGEGLHSIARSNTFEYTLKRKSGKINKGDVVIAECTIPKDSLYYKNPLDMYVSNQLIVDKIITLDEYKY